MRYCSFCKTAENEVKKIVHSDFASICGRCVDMVVESMAPKTQAEDHVVEPVGPPPTPKAIKAHLDAHVIGQERAKVAISVGLYNHFKRRTQAGQEERDVEIEKSNIMILGPTGTGKTLLARIAAKILGVPFYAPDATSLTQAGYVGNDVESILQGLIAAAGGDLEKAKWGIVFLDEIDKIARKTGRSASGDRDITGEGVQQALLKLIEGSVVSVPKGGMKAMGQGADELDTSNILFIVSGSFAGIEEIVRRRVNARAKMGFGSEEKREVDLTEVYRSATEDDILAFGLIPEFVGRFPVVTSTLPLTEEQMCQILTEPKGALVKQYRALFGMDNIDLVFEPEAIRAIGKKAMKRPTAARALRAIVEELVNPAIFELSGNPNVRSVRITEDAVEGRSEPTVIYESLQRAG